VLIYATGFQWMGTSTFNMVSGRGGRTLMEKWESEGTRTFLGLHSRGFRNLFIVTGPQGGGGGRGWDKFRGKAQSSLDPYVFGGEPN
jgi:cation diffusion facilitator CzcD-associated flavoprotein CzcO